MLNKTRPPKEVLLSQAIVVSKSFSEGVCIYLLLCLHCYKYAFRLFTIELLKNSDL